MANDKPKPQRDAKGHFIKREAVQSPVEDAVDRELEEMIEEAQAPVQGVKDTPTLPILKAVNDLLADIRGNHSDLPAITVVVGAAGASRRGQVHGHFYPESWEGEAKHEIMLSGESLQRGAVPTLGTILHECAHALAHTRGVKDTSNNGRYHNKKFKEIAEEVGIEVESAPTLGWSLTSVPEDTTFLYEDGIERLAAALTTYRAPKSNVTEKKPRKTTKFKVQCGCEDPVTVSKQWFERHESSLMCQDCMEPFLVIENDDEDEDGE